MSRPKYAGLKIDGRPLPRFMMYVTSSGRDELRTPSKELALPYDVSTKLRALRKYPGVALISSIDGGLGHKKFLCYSFLQDEEKHIMTAYMAYMFSGPVIVRAWDTKKKSLLENIDMYHIDISPARTPEKVIQKHLQRVKGKKLQTKGLRDLAEKTYFDMLRNVP